MYDSKSIFASRTIIASILALVCMVLSASGVSQDLLLPDVQTQIVDGILMATQAASTLAAIYFRVTATNRLT